MRRSSLQQLPASTGQTGAGDRSDRSPENPAVDQRTPTREGPCQGRCSLGCPRLGRPVRTSSHCVEVVEAPDWRAKRGTEWKPIKIPSMKQLSLYPDFHPRHTSHLINRQDDTSQFVTS
jgi:hypothetical protein